MGKETYQIKVCVHDEVVAFAGAMNPKGELACEDEMYSPERYKLESCNPEDSIPVATFYYEKYSPKKAYFYVASFKEAHSIAKHQQAFSLFAIRWDKEENNWQKVPEYCCFVKSERPQPPLHKEAADWMLKEITAEGSEAYNADYFKNGTLEILI